VWLLGLGFRVFSSKLTVCTAPSACILYPGLGGEASKPAGEMRQKSPESAAQPMLVDGTVLEEDTEVTHMDIERAQEIAAGQQK
jgi:hypothetical protein